MKLLAAVCLYTVAGRPEEAGASPGRCPDAQGDSGKPLPGPMASEAGCIHLEILARQKRIIDFYIHLV